MKKKPKSFWENVWEQFKELESEYGNGNGNGTGVGKIEINRLLFLIFILLINLINF